jgi:hypothetical protein
MDHSMTETLKQQTQVLFSNMEAAFRAADRIDFNKPVIRGPLWKHFYHMLHSLDQWFINPYQYTEPAFHETGLNLIDKSTPEKALSKQTLLEYYHGIRIRIEKYQEELDVTKLTEYPEGSRFSRLTLILAQFRHLMYHIGFIHACIMKETGSMPEFFGISPPLDL